MAFTWPDDAVAMLHRLWRDRDKISGEEMAIRINREFNCSVSANSIAKKASREGLPAARDGSAREKKTRAKPIRLELLVNLRKFISSEMDAGTERDEIIQSALARFDVPRHRIATIWRQEKEKRKDAVVEAFTPPPEMSGLHLTNGNFATDPKSYELIQRARRAA